MIDEKDRKIISKLQEDGRASIVEISKEIGLSSMGTKKRIDKLIHEGIVKVKAMLNVDKLDIKLAIIAMELESGEHLRDILKKFYNCPRVIRFFVTAGSYNLFALVWAEDYHTLESISLECCSLRAQKGVKRFEFLPVFEVHYEPYIDIHVMADKKFEKPPCGVDCGSCVRYEEGKCMGCPATPYYRGML